MNVPWFRLQFFNSAFKSYHPVQCYGKEFTHTVSLHIENLKHSRHMFIWYKFERRINFLQLSKSMEYFCYPFSNATGCDIIWFDGITPEYEVVVNRRITCVQLLIFIKRGPWLSSHMTWSVVYCRSIIFFFFAQALSVCPSFYFITHCYNIFLFFEDLITQILVLEM